MSRRRSGTFLLFFLASVFFTFSGSQAAAQGGGREQGGGRRPQEEIPLTIISTPAKCQVLIEIEGREVRRREETTSQGRLVIRLQGGQYKIQVSKEGYKSQERTINLTRAQVARFDLRPVYVEPVYVDLIVSTDPPDVRVYLDGEDKGMTGSNGQLLIPKVPAGQHTVIAKREGYLDERLSVTVSLESPMVRITLKRDPVWEQIETIKSKAITGQLAEAFNLYDQIAEKKPDHSGLPAAVESILEGLHDTSQKLLAAMGVFGLRVTVDQADKMSQLYDKVQRVRPQDETILAFAHYWKAKYFGAKAKQATTEADKKHYLESQRLEMEALRKLDPPNAHIQYELGWFYEAVDRPGAKRHFAHARELPGNWALPHYALAKLRMSECEPMGGKNERKKCYEQIIKDLKRAIETAKGSPDDYFIYADRCVCYAKIGKHTEALADGEQAVRLKGDSAYSHYALGFAYYQKKGKKEFSNAKSELEQALELKMDELNEGMRELVQQWLAEINKAK